MTFNTLGVFRAWQISANGVKKWLNALVLERTTAKHWHNLHLQSGSAQSTLDFVDGDGRWVVEVFFHKLVVEFGDCFEHLVAIAFSFVNQVCRNFFFNVVGTLLFIRPVESLHLHKVNDSLECFLSTDRNFNRARISTEHVVHLTANLKEVGTAAVHLVHVTDTRHVVFVSLTPNGFRLRFNTTNGAESGNGTIEHTQRTFNFNSEIDVSRSVNQVDFILVVIIIPECGSCSRSDSDTTFLLLFHPVHGGSTIVHFTDFVSQTGIEQNTFRSSCFAGIDVSHDADIASKI